MADDRRDDAFLDHFPNLVPELEAGHSVFRLGEDKGDQRSIIIGERVRFAALIRAIAQARVSARCERPADQRYIDLAGYRAMHAYYARAYRLQAREMERDLVRFVGTIRRARALIVDLAARFFDKRTQKQLEMTSEVDVESDPVRLLRLCCEGGTDALSSRRRFEARRQLTIAHLLFEAEVLGNGVDDLERDMTAFDDDLKRSFFLSRKSVSCRITATLDLGNMYRVDQAGVRIEPSDGAGHPIGISDGAFELETDLRFVPSGGRDIPVYYETRIKRDAVWKLIRKAQRQTTRLDDLCGVKLVFLNDADLLAGVDHLRKTMAREPGCYFGDASNLASSGQADEENVHSAAEYRVKKYFGIAYRRVFEIQVMLMQDWINEQFSLGEENHGIYRLRTFRDDLFPRLFPTVFYRVPWQDEAFRRKLLKLQTDRI